MSGKVVIVGAGLAGLSAGIHLQKQGIGTDIFELAPWAGGMCTAWERQGYRFDGCIHWMVGTRPGDPIRALYQEVGALKEDTEIHNALSMRVEIGGRMLEIPLEYEAFRAFLMKEAAGDPAVEAILRDVKRMAETEMPMGAPDSLPGLMRMLMKSRGFFALAAKHTGKTVSQYLSGIKSEPARQILTHLMPPEYSATALIMMLGTRLGGNAGYPMGGASAVTCRMVEKYEALGGRLHLNARVDEIVVECSKARGVRVKGEFIPADFVLAACDAHGALKNLLGGKFPHPQLDGMLQSAPLFDPLLLVSFGLDRRFDIPYSVTYECAEGIATSPSTVSHALSLRSFDFDPAAAPEGGSSVMVMMEAPFEYWDSLRKNSPDEYKAQKQRLSDAVAAALDKRIRASRPACASRTCPPRPPTSG